MGLRKLDVRILVWKVIRTPGNPIIIVRYIQIFLVVNVQIKAWVGGLFDFRTLFGFVNPHKLLDDP